MPDELTYEQAYMAMKALGEVHLKMRKPGDWYCYVSRAELGGDGFLRGLGGDGATPQEAILSHWHNLTFIPPGRYIALGAWGDDPGRRVRWNGFMWEDVPISNPERVGA